MQLTIVYADCTNPKGKEKYFKAGESIHRYNMEIQRLRVRTLI